MGEHRQELVLAAVLIRQRQRLLLRLPLQAAAFADVPDVALGDLLPVHRVDVADELDLDLPTALGLQGQVVVADVALLPQFVVGDPVRIPVPEQADLSEFLAQEFVVLVAQQPAHERVGVDDLARAGVEDEDAVLGRLEEPTIAEFGALHGGVGPPAFGPVLDRQEDEGRVLALRGGSGGR